MKQLSNESCLCQYTNAGLAGLEHELQGGNYKWFVNNE